MSKSKRVYWKVITKDSRHSALHNHFNGEQNRISVHYPVGQWVKPIVPESLLFVFATKEAALGYASTCTHIVVPCHVKNPRKLKKTCVVSNISANTSAEFWKLFKKARELHKSLSYTHNFGFTNLTYQFEDTVFCDEVFCLE